MEGQQIHEVIGVAQEGMHSIKTKKLKGEVLKIDLSKAYDRVNWIYIRQLLTHLGFEINFISWVMCCISTNSFFVLINGSSSPFFRVKRGLHHGFPFCLSFFYLWLKVSVGLWNQQNQIDILNGFLYLPPFESLIYCLTIDNIIILSPNHRHAATPMHRNL
jgi:hypothetical protein